MRCLTRMCACSRPFLSLQWNDLRRIEGYPGIKIGGHKVSNMRYADDAVLIAENKEDLPQLLDITEEESRRKGYGLKSKNTEVMVVNRNNECAQISSLVAKGNSLRNQCKYLGTWMWRDGQTTMKSHQKRHWSVLLNPSLCMDVRLGQFKKQLQN